MFPGMMHERNLKRQRRDVALKSGLDIKTWDPAFFIKESDSMLEYGVATKIIRQLLCPSLREEDFSIANTCIVSIALVELHHV